MLLGYPGKSWKKSVMAIMTVSGACVVDGVNEQDTVICTGQGLLRIPSRIPPDTVRLDLQENKISEIRKNDLKALRRLKILLVAFHISSD
ncbi:unnamed protein product [Onchocerca ochengi]|uniref:Leucine-rich repeat protein n=1 Tax=Onchocerca ochengi TaxID=42157 RepID=A0A182E9M7_ONCOC|nr:unnamed protein product [Onchocerca ochengi]